MCYILNNKTVLLVDDGIATGATMFAAAQWVTRQKPKLIVAVPVAPKESIDKLSEVADRIVVIHCCSSYDNVGEHYIDFTEVRDDEVERIMKK